MTFLPHFLFFFKKNLLKEINLTIYRDKNKSNMWFFLLKFVFLEGFYTNSFRKEFVTSAVVQGISSFFHELRGVWLLGARADRLLQRMSG